jgi:hypothetical protein
MNEQREEPQAVVESSDKPQYNHLNDNEEPGELLCGWPGWFKGAALFTEVYVTYFVHERGVLLIARIQQPNGEIRPWLRHWTSHIEAVRAAESLIGEAVAYLQQMTNGHAMRETENLDYDDFIDHITIRMNNDFQ